MQTTGLEKILEFQIDLRASSSHIFFALGQILLVLFKE